MKLRLRHSGIKGMKWGVRKKKSSSGSSKGRTKTKSVKSMSDKEIQSYLSRIDLEKRYKAATLTGGQVGKQAVSKILIASATSVAAGLVTVGMKKGLDYAWKAALKKMG